jgi:ketosteroid isomerase-like protein
MAVEDNKKHGEAEIKRVLEGGVEAARARDIDGMMSIYAPELVSFDLVPPLRYVGADAYRKRWEEVFSSLPGSIGYEMHDLDIITGDDVAFGHSLNRLSGTLNTGQKIDLWVRWTACLRKIDGQGLIVHTQVSVPVDLGNGKAVLSLKPCHGMFRQQPGTRGEQLVTGRHVTPHLLTHLAYPEGVKPFR